MTVKQLIDHLQQLPPEAEVWEECRGEFRRLAPEDVRHRPQATIYDNEEGDILEDQNVVVLVSWA